jgi:hypothetical protein
MTTAKTVTIDYFAALEALEAMRAIAGDKSSYIHKRYTDDISIFMYSMDKLERAIKEQDGTEAAGFVGAGRE